MNKKGTGPLHLLRRILDARRGDVRAMEDVYHLRSVLNFVVVFLVTIVVPGASLAYYGFAGIRADELAAAASLDEVGSTTGDELSRRVGLMFQRFEDNANNRMKSGQSVVTAPGELSTSARVVLQFDEGGALVAPFVLPSAGGEPDDLLLFAPWAAARSAERAGDHPKAAALYLQAAREARSRLGRAESVWGRARMLVRLGESAQADALFGELVSSYAEQRDHYGFRFGDLARLARAEEAQKRAPEAGSREIVALVESLLNERWTLGEGGEAAIAEQAVRMLTKPPDPNWAPRATKQIDDRVSQLYWAGRLQPELDKLGVRGGLLRGNPGTFSYWVTPTALWAMTWTERDQYAFALELAALLAQVEELADAVAGPNSVVRARVVPPDGLANPDALARVSLSRWLPGYTAVVEPRDPGSLAEDAAEKRLQSFLIIGTSILVIVFGMGLSAAVVRRELDAARTKSDFAAHVSHELRSPITQIRLKAEALQLGLATDDAARARHYDVIVRESERLSRLVDNILDFAAIERGMKRYSFRPGDLGATVQRVVEAARVSMEMRGMALELSLPDDLPVVDYDPDAIAQVVHNLLSNAAKYGQEAGWVGVSVRNLPGAVEVSVADRGIGIAEAEQKQIFEQYYRSADPQARRRKGTGIGLTIVKYIMEAHGGAVSVSSAPGQGSTFTLTFPLTPTAPRAGA